VQLKWQSQELTSNYLTTYNYNPLSYKFSDTLFSKVPIVGILRGYPKNITLRIIDTYLRSGFTTIEVTLNTPNVSEIISTAVEKYKGSLNVGAGTVCSDEDLDLALAAGAQFIVSPITDLTMIKKCKELNVPIFPGAFSPTEIYQAWTTGAKMVKLFPASQLGPKYVKDVLAPLDFIDIMPTGGVGLNNIEEYRNIGVKAFGMGGLLFKKELIENGAWEELSEHLVKIKKAIMS